MDTCYQRTEQRGVNLLLKAIPLDQQQALITDRELTSTALLYRLLARYQPGGAGRESDFVGQADGPGQVSWSS